LRWRLVFASIFSMPNIPQSPAIGSAPSIIRDYFKLLRVPHYIKNLLVFVPLFFSERLLKPEYILVSAGGFLCFSLVSSFVYILNDIRDIEKDRAHSTKCRRPLASGRVPIPTALFTGALTLVAAATLVVLWAFFGRAGIISTSGQNLAAFPIWLGAALPAAYALVNIAYSYGLKNVPIIDVTILALGFVLRVYFGAVIIGVEISVWLYLTITVGSFYMGFGKRRNEIRKNEKHTRDVNKFYSHNFLDKNMYLCMALSVVFYALWSIDPKTVSRIGTDAFVFTVPLFLIILLKYSLNVESESDGDPTAVILHDKFLLVLLAIYAIVAAAIIFSNQGIIQ
jgi:4-hydroxybenzoate polyprenyltransferase